MQAAIPIHWMASAFNPVPPSPAGEGALSSWSQRGLPQLDPPLCGPRERLTAPQADGQQSVRLPPPGNVPVCFAPRDASLGLRIVAHDPGNRLMPTLTAGARSIRTLFPGCRFVLYGPCAKCVTGLKRFRPPNQNDMNSASSTP
jgi:hypothetical protein